MVLIASQSTSNLYPFSYYYSVFHHLQRESGYFTSRCSPFSGPRRHLRRSSPTHQYPLRRTYSFLLRLLLNPPLSPRPPPLSMYPPNPPLTPPIAKAVSASPKQPPLLLQFQSSHCCWSLYHASLSIKGKITERRNRES